MFFSSALRRARPLPCLRYRSTLVNFPVGMPPKRKRATKDIITTEVSLAETSVVTAEGVDGTVVSQDLAPRRKTSTRARKPVSYAEQEATNEDGTNTAESPLTEIEDKPKTPAKKRRTTKNTEPEVYDIPPVETKETSFKGRYSISLVELTPWVHLDDSRSTRICMPEHYSTCKEARADLLFPNMSKGYYPQEWDPVRKGSGKAEH